MSDSKRIRGLLIVSKAAGIANSAVETVGPLGLGLVNLNGNFTQDKDYFYDGQSHIASWLVDFVAIYGITKGVLQVIEGIGIAQGYRRDTNRMMGGAQIAAGIATAIAGLLYEFAGTSVASLAVTLYATSFVRAFTLLKRGLDWKNTIKNSQEGANYIDHALNRPDSPIGLHEGTIGCLSQLGEVFAFIGLHHLNAIFGPGMFATGFLMKGALFAPVVYEKVKRGLTLVDTNEPLLRRQ